MKASERQLGIPAVLYHIVTPVPRQSTNNWQTPYWVTHNKSFISTIDMILRYSHCQTVFFGPENRSYVLPYTEQPPFSIKTTQISEVELIRFKNGIHTCICPNQVKQINTRDKNLLLKILRCRDQPIKGYRKHRELLVYLMHRTSLWIHLIPT